MSTAFGTFYANVTGLLSQIAPSIRGTNAPGKHGNTPRYVWIWKGATDAGGILPNGGNPKPIGEDWHSFEVHCWDKTEIGLEALRAALITAIRRDVGPCRYRIGNSEIADSDSGETKGVFLVIDLEVRLPLLPALLPTSQPVTFPTVVVVAADTDSTGATTGDGTLQQGEP